MRFENDGSAGLRVDGDNSYTQSFCGFPASRVGFGNSRLAYTASADASAPRLALHRPRKCAWSSCFASRNSSQFQLRELAFDCCGCQRDSSTGRHTSQLGPVLMGSRLSRGFFKAHCGLGAACMGVRACKAAA